MTNSQLSRARKLLCDLQCHIRDTLIAARARHSSRFANIATVTAADTIYHIDKISEEAICRWFEKHWPRTTPVQVVMEGIEEGQTLTFPRKTPVACTVWKCILDPIDGTRGLMYDKRSAWILGGLARQRGEQTNLTDIIVAAMTELPTTKQWRSDQISAVRGAGSKGGKADWTDVRTGEHGRLRLRPSRADNFQHGFASLARFFPDGKALLAELEEALWKKLHHDLPAGSPLVFDDQYISTGGQLYELLAGHDRMIGDLRPMAFAKLGLDSALVCHPYDICTEVILTESGGIVEKPLGGQLDAPLDTVSPVSWVGFANEQLADLARPTLRRLIRDRLT